MYILDITTRSLQVILGGAVSATEPTWTVHYKKLSKAGVETHAPAMGLTTSGTAVTMIAAPAAGDKIFIESITLHNSDSASVTATVRINDNGTFRTLFKATLATLETLVYESGAGWLAYTTAGAIK